MVNDKSKTVFKMKNDKYIDKKKKTIQPLINHNALQYII